jgi:demethylmenaquinone methyltransferase/2-methoxy-6-polyprenyl-1,4-benzoquinol methylase
MEINPALYNILIDTLLQKMRQRVSMHISYGSSVIDIACGTGAQVFQLAYKCRSITGIDISPPMIEYAEKKRIKNNLQNLSFKITDATDLSHFKDKEFDFSIMSLALHQFRSEDRILILKEAGRISEEILIADYSNPQPHDIYGLGIKIAERMAGKEHFTNFKSYLSSGGLTGISNETGLKTIHQEVFAKGVFVLGIFSKS